ncbi:hypothetical protein GCM10010222_21640 [Streptomyces tanashiensis]|nr:hypothetical protein GCM10010222_21640 [Streptomyces tanashiensis]
MRRRSSGLGATAQNEDEVATCSAMTTPESDEVSLSVVTVAVACPGSALKERAIGRRTTPRSDPAAMRIERVNHGQSAKNCHMGLLSHT